MFRNLLSKYTIHNVSSDRYKLDINVMYKIMSDDNNRKPLKKTLKGALQILP